MADPKNEHSKDAPDEVADDHGDEAAARKPGDMARRIWLAGIGAYGKAFEEGLDRVKGLSNSLPGNVSGKTSDVFETLAEKGERLEQAAKVKGAQLAGRASTLSDELQSSLAIDDRIQAMRDRLSGTSDDRLDAVEDRLARIEAKLDKLLADKPASKTTPAKKATTKRTTTARTKKAPPKKPSTKKT